MLNNSIVLAASLSQVATTFVSLAAYLPQWSKLYRTKSSESISLSSWCIWAVSTSMTLFYAIVQFKLNGMAWPLVFSTTATLIFTSFTIHLILKFRPPGRAGERVTGGIGATQEGSAKEERETE
jgi:uncharacterized protein with PQ loop repeat